MRQLIGLLCYAIGLTAVAQDVSSLYLRNLQQASGSEQTRLLEPPVLEHPIDENEYIVGAGDFFSIFVGSDVDKNHQLMVLPEGLLVIPDVGDVEVAGKTLKEVKEAIVKKLKSTYYSENIYVSLVRLRTFRVSVTGAIETPRLVNVNGLDRLSDAIIRAGGFIEPSTSFNKSDDTDEQNRNMASPTKSSKLSEEELKELKQNAASKRNVLIKRRDGSILRVDHLKFELAGDLEENPFLLDGDVIVIPTVQEQAGKVSISGAVRTPNTFEYAQDDRVLDLLELSHGFTTDADSSKIYIARFLGNSNRAQEIVLDIDWSDSNYVEQVMNTRLQPDDRIFVRRVPQFHEKRTVEIRGEVNYPGEYALLKNPTRLTELIETAGGFTEDAALNAAHVVRRSFEERKDAEFERLELMTAQEMSRQEKVYFRERARELKGLVSTDFVALFENGEDNYDITLEDQDLVVVPKKDHTVNVVGHVKQPGLVPYLPNLDAAYYIENAGGYNIRAWKKKVRVQRAGTGVLLSAKNTTVEMGDTIFVPEKLENENLIRDILLITVQLATVVVLIIQTNIYASSGTQ
ncbi:hypothetical protein EH223_20000 [candidate division KSB1 bacterium]|nr:SLBB domain-containing protein [candidate division KSB1 bacterium]RQW00222.1 MAG: hypothetical protein EH223_20000 [candidate division KSB1 bacterium]